MLFGRALGLLLPDRHSPGSGPAGGDHGGGALVPALRPLLSRGGKLLAEREIEVDHVTIYRWVQRFTPLLADAARFTRHAPGDRWFVDET
jgi:hypothetical protein